MNILPEEFQPEAVDPTFNFENCAFRSDEEIEKTIRTCGCRPPVDLKEFECSHFKIYPLTSNFCAMCKSFQQK